MERFNRIFHSVMYWVGVVTTALILALLVVAGYLRMDYIANNPTLERGVVTGYSYNDGHTTYVDYVFGDWILRKVSGDGKDHYYLQITNDYGHIDYWEVSQEDYATVEIGTAVTKSQFK